jgi:hypothetical protein
MGPFLGPASSGIFIKRTVDQWINGYEDPLTSPRYPPGDPRRLVRAVTKTFQNSDLEAATAVDRLPHAVTDRKEWAGLGGALAIIVKRAHRVSIELKVPRFDLNTRESTRENQINKRQIKIPIWIKRLFGKAVRTIIYTPRDFTPEIPGPNPKITGSIPS